MNTIVTHQNCGACKALKDMLGNNPTGIKYVDIDSPEGKILDEKFKIEAVPFATDGNKQCKIMVHDEKTIKIECDKNE